MSTALAPHPRPELSALDRCDRCGAQAFAQAVLPAGDLLFCGHHFRQYEDSLRKLAIEVHDETGRLAGGSQGTR